MLGAVYIVADGRTRDPQLPPAGISLAYEGIGVGIQPSPPTSSLGGLTITMAAETLKGIMMYMVNEGWRAARVDIRHDALGPVGFAVIRPRAEDEEEEGKAEFL